MATILKETRERPGKAALVRFRVWYTDQNGKRRGPKFKTEKEARTEKLRIEVELKGGVHTPSADSITVAEAGELWLMQCRTDGLEPSTIVQYRTHFLLHIKPYLGAIKLADLNQGHLQRLRDRLAEGNDATGPRSRGMIKRVVRSLGAILEAARSYGKLARNIVHEQPRSRLSRQQRIEKRHEKRLEVGTDIPTKDELRAMLTTTLPLLRAMIAAAAFTGLRVSELRGLRWRDIDFMAEILTVRQRADCFGTIGSPKSKAARRTVPLTPLTINTLKAWKLACPKGPADLVFPTPQGKVVNVTTLTRTTLGPLQLDTGVTDVAVIRAAHPELSEKGIIRYAYRHPKYSFHAFRHAAASMFIEDGWTAKEVQEVMGHSTIQLTFDTYGHLFPQPEERKAKMRRMQARLLG